MRPHLLLVCALAMGCKAPEAPPVPEAEPVTPLEELFAKAAVALKDADVARIKWGLTPYLDVETLVANYSPILSYVESRVGVPIDLLVGDDYADLEIRLVQGQVDAAIISPYSYVRAKASQPGITIFASHIAQGSERYGAYIITHEESGIESIGDLVNKSFAFVDRRSTSGWLFPAARMLEEGIHPARDVHPRFLGSHTEVFQAVLERRFDAGATYEGALGEGRRRNPDAAVMLRVVAKSRRVPHEAYAVRDGFPPVAAEALGRALSEISTATAEGRRLLAPLLRLNGFMPVEDSHYDVIREVEAEVRAAGLEFAP